MCAVTALELLEEDERHARMRHEAAKARLAHLAEDERADYETLLEELEQEWKAAAERLHAARGQES